MRILVVGSGAREHALAWRFAREGAEVHVAPGNGGTAQLATNHDARDLDAIVALARRLEAGLVVVGPEAPLVEGLVDRLQEAGVATFGPSRASARLEGSKIFSKQLMRRAGVPTADFEVFEDPDAADAYIRSAARPLVVKADGLAAGKGVTVALTPEAALDAVDQIMRRRAFGDAGAQVLIEECLVGPEVSYHVVSDGQRYVPLAPAQDHKRAYDGDRGPNTGGMGAYSPPPIVTPEIERAIQARVVEPTLEQMQREGQPFRGALFVGLMIVDGEPQVLEYNVRFGDPETECLMTRWGGSAIDLFEGAARGDLGGMKPQWDAPASLCVVMASGGYPGSYEKGKPITGIQAADAVEGVTVFHAGTRRDADAIVTNGGRVLCVTATGDSIRAAHDRAYAAAAHIDFAGKMLRTDIGHRAL